MTRTPSLVAVDSTNFDTLPCCGIKAKTHPGRQEKSCWLQANARFGVRSKALIAPDGDPGGYLECLPGEFAWRGVDAAGYLFIQCIWIYASRYQRKGWGSLLLDACLQDAVRMGMSGVAAMARNGPWCADRRLFLANGFEAVDTAPPDYELLVRKLKRTAANPSFRTGWEEKLAQYGQGLTIIRSSQCPHIAKFASEIAQSARDDYGISPTIVDLASWEDAQNAPTPYAVFSLIYNGQLLADHQISRTRFHNIMRKLLGA